MPVHCSILSVPWSWDWSPILSVGHGIVPPQLYLMAPVRGGAGTQGGGGEINQQFAFRAEISWPGEQDLSDASSSHLICDAQAESGSKNLQ